MDQDVQRSYPLKSLHHEYAHDHDFTSVSTVIRIHYQSDRLLKAGKSERQKMACPRFFKPGEIRI